MKKYSLLLLLFWIVVAGCEVATSPMTVDEIKEVTQDSSVYKFPVFKSASASKPHEKMNETLQQQELDLLVGQQDSSAFEKISGEAGVMWVDYKIILNTQRLVTVEIAKEACGAYCTEYSNYYNFDAATGELIPITKIFTEDGLNQLVTAITEHRRAAIKEAMKTATADGEDDTASMFQQCLEYITPENFFTGSFYIADTEIHFVRERCGPHAMLDTLGAFDDIWSVSDLQSYLSEYGKSVLL